MRRFTRGYRFGEGQAISAVLPGSLLELWKAVQLCVEANVIVIAQAANTGLTGGSTPFGNDYDRDVVIINTMRVRSVQIIDDGRQVIAFPGTTLDQLEKVLKPLGREPHSVIGSSCLGASVIGGICNNSGGSLIHRGPAYTELALFAQVDEDNVLHLVNHLDIDLGTTPQEMLTRLDGQFYSPGDIAWDDSRRASDHDYVTHIRDIESGSPARFNADDRRLFEASGCAGKVIVFAVRLDTFDAAKNPKVFYIGTNEPRELTHIRRSMLSSFSILPIAAEYIHREAFNIAERYGKDTFLLVKTLGTGRLPRMFALKSRIDGFAERLRFMPANLSDRIMQAASRLFPSHLPGRMRLFRDRFEHHLMIKVSGEAVEEAGRFLEGLYPTESGEFFECTQEEGAAAFLHRFATAGAAVRYRAVHAAEIGGIVALDIALPRNEFDWVETLPPQIEKKVQKKLYYGHFFCFVFHQDYLIEKGVDWLETEHEILRLLDSRKARYPAEHNVGHLYKAEEILAQHYRTLDPCNCFNPGIGQTSKMARWG